MKIAIKIVFLFFYFSCNIFAQNIKVEYKTKLKTLERNGFLHIFSEKTPFYYERAVSNLQTIESSKKSIKADSNSLVYTISPNNSEKWYQIYSIKKDTILNIDYIGDKQVVYFDVFTSPEWTLTEDEKKISGYNCIKAYTYFRGRNYTAWFTYDIPVSFGPWKFSGLPGLILEIYDDEKKFTWLATRIIPDIPISEFNPDLKNKKRVSFKEFIKLKEIDNQEEINKFMLRFSSSNTIILDQKWNRGRELKYDWEK